MKKRAKSFLMDLIMLPLCFVIAYPILFILIGSFKSRAEFASNPYGWVQEFNLQNYITAFEKSPFLSLLWNNLIIAFGSVIIVTLISAMAAYPVVYHKCRFNNVMKVYLLLGFFIPFQATLLPLYQMYSTLGLMDKVSGIVLLYSAGISLPFFMFVGYMKGIPHEMAEAAMIDGCGIGRIFFRIIFPLTRPVMITVIIFTFFSSWNNYLAPSLFLTSRDKGVLILEVTRAATKNVIDWGRTFAVVTITIIFPFIFFLFTQKSLSKGMASGGVKG